MTGRDRSQKVATRRSVHPSFQARHLVITRGQSITRLWHTPEANQIQVKYLGTGSLRRAVVPQNVGRDLSQKVANNLEVGRDRLQKVANNFEVGRDRSQEVAS